MKLSERDSGAIPPGPMRQAALPPGDEGRLGAPGQQPRPPSLFLCHGRPADGTSSLPLQLPDPGDPRLPEGKLPGTGPLLGADPGDRRRLRPLPGGQGSDAYSGEGILAGRLVRTMARTLR